MSKHSTQSVSNTLSPRDQQYQDYIRQMAQHAAGNPFQGFAGFDNNQTNPLTMEANAGFSGYADAGRMGLGALTGDTADVAKLMNPYLQTLNPMWAKMRAAGLSAADSNATAQGAFGGSRTGVAEGVANSNVTMQQAQQQYQAFNDAMGRAGQMANLGMGANSALQQSGQFQQGMDMNMLMQRYNEFLRGQNYPQTQLGMLEGAMGPTGSTQSQQMASNPWMQALGLGMMFIPGMQGAGAATIGKGSPGGAGGLTL